MARRLIATMTCMGRTHDLILIGPSVRAAAFSALRAGMQPWCADLFADEDLRLHCDVVQLPRSDYPRCLPQYFAAAPDVPWMYTGGLENHPALIAKLTKQRPLWGIDAEVLRRVRNPRAVAQWLHQHEIACPQVRENPPTAEAGNWLVKSIASAGGRGIHQWRGKSRRHVYFQEFIAGLPCAAIYVGTGNTAQLLGVTRQLVSQPWLHAAPFSYCGSVGPLSLTAAVQTRFEALGQALVDGFSLRGTFGVDCILRDETPYPVEVNPRYTASVEVLEYAMGIKALERHRAVFEDNSLGLLDLHPTGLVGKAIVFARRTLAFPAAGPWEAALERRTTFEDVPAYADVPAAGCTVQAGQPVLSIFAVAKDETHCLDQLRQFAQNLDRWLYRRYTPRGSM